MTETAEEIVGAIIFTATITIIDVEKAKKLSFIIVDVVVVAQIFIIRRKII